MKEQSLEQILEETKTPWGEIGYITYKRSYARRLREDDPNSETEEFPQTIKRIIDASRSQLKVGFSESEEKELAKILLELKGSVAGRFLWQLGTKTVKKLGLFSLQNCCFVTIDSPIEPFTWTFDAMMLGAGVGYNIQKENVYQLPKIKGKIKIERKETPDADFIVPDSREGWVKLLGKVLKAHFYSGESFTYSTLLVRGSGSPIKGFGGTASGPEELCKGISEIHKILNSRSGQKLRPIDCLDIMNIIGMIVVSGNVRRSAAIAIGDPDDTEFLKAKRWDLGTIPNWRNMSNNTVMCSNPKDLTKEFWETYEQGEPYGICNIPLSKKIGRLGETQYPDTCVGYNPSLRAGTKVYTSEGIVNIEDLEGKDFITRNLRGEEAKANCWLSGKNQTLWEVTLENGKKYYCTPEHKWAIHKEGGYTKKNTTELIKGDLLPILRKNSLDYGTLGDRKDGFFLGWLYGDGSYAIRTDGRKQIFLIVSEKDQKFGIHEKLLDKLEEITGFRYKMLVRGKNLELSVSNKKLSEYLDLFSVSKKEEGLPKSIWKDGSEEFRKGFIDGLFSADCYVKNSKKSSNIVIHQSNFKLASDLSELIGFYGIKHCYYNRTIKGVFPNGKDYEKEYHTKVIKISHRDSIEHFQNCFPLTHGDKSEKISNISKISKRSLLNRTHYAIIEVKETDIKEDVWDVRVDDDTHCFQLSYSITGNCAEQSLESMESCCLAEIFLPNITSEEELFKVATYLYRICKHSLSLPCHHKKTEEVVHRNMRMGIGITGTLMATEEQRSWLSNCYEKLREYDVEYSKKNNWPVSIKLTTSKPSGSLSLLAGVTPGIHPSPAGPYYIRRIRISSNSNLIKVCRDKGYDVEFQKNFDGTDDHTTYVVSFPCMVPEGTPVAGSISAIEHLELVKWMQKNWSDNSVSCTVYYTKEEMPEIKKWLEENLENNVKTLSFLLYHGHGFTQAPYETMSREDYHTMKSKVEPIKSVSFKEDEISGVDECANGACPIK